MQDSNLHRHHQTLRGQSCSDHGYRGGPINNATFTSFIQENQPTSVLGQNWRYAEITSSANTKFSIKSW